MPGLLRGLVRVAAVAGTATAVSNRVSRRQGRRWSTQEQEQEQDAQQQQQDASPPPPAAPARDAVTQLKELAELKTQGVLTDAEFEDQKAKILAS
jgi:Short C-terminal domain